MPKILGIDLGTTNSAIACVDGSDMVIIPNDRGNRVTPSIVAFTQNGEVLVGESAKNQAVVNANQTVIAVKRWMGKAKIFSINGKGYSPEEISSFILKKLKKDAEQYLGEEVREVVITVPAHFNDKQRKATQEAGRLAGLSVKRILNEPTAAALAHAYKSDANKNILVYDLGGGTFDVTCLTKNGNRYEVKSTEGDNNIGGIYFDELLTYKVVRSFITEATVDFTDDKVLMQQLAEIVEGGKIELSSREESFVALPFLGSLQQSDRQSVHMSYTLKRQEFNDLIREKIDHTIALMQKAIENAGWTKKDIDTLILSGGSSRIPYVRNTLKNTFNLTAQRLINPEEIVSLGAAVQGELIRNQTNDIILKDITPSSLGVEIENDTFVKVIPKNTQLPARAQKTCTTVSDDQNSVEIHILQGESEYASANESLGRFLLSGIRPGKRGIPRIIVTFDLDVDGILRVDAVDKDTGVRQRITLSPNTDLQEATEETEKTEESDDYPIYKYKNKVNSLIRRIEGLRHNLSDRVDTDFQKEIDTLLKESRRAVLDLDRDKLWEDQLALETIIGELNALDSHGGALNEGA